MTAGVTTNVKNIKLSFPLSRVFLPIIRSYFNIQREGRTFFIFKFEQATFLIYKENGYVNVTGLKTVGHILPVLELFVKKLQQYTTQPIEFPQFKIDNITASGHFKNVPQTRFAQTLTHLSQNNPFFSVFYRPEVFPGATLRFFNKHNGSIILFSSGKFNSVGCKDENSIQNATLIVHALLSRRYQYEL